MKLSTRGVYGLRAMVDLAIYGEESPTSIKNISERQSISENYLEQIIAVLRKSGFVKSSRGAQGGYSLNKEPTNISVGDILRVLEGDLNPVDCIIVNDEKTCSEADLCVTKFVWKKISDSINEVVNNITLKDLMNEQKTIHEENNKN